jgi:hypothetical protein
VIKTRTTARAETTARARTTARTRMTARTRESVRNIAKKKKWAEDTVVVDKPMYR